MTVLIRKKGWQNSPKCWRIPKENVSDFSFCFLCLCNFGSYSHIHVFTGLPAIIPNAGNANIAKTWLGFQCLIKLGRKDESKNKERAFTSLPILQGIALFPNIKRMFWLTSIWHACTQRHQICKKKNQKYSSSFIKDSAFTRKTYPGLESVQRWVLRLYHRHKMHKWHYPISGSAITSLGSLF